MNNLNKGFTLLEVLAALAISSILLIAGAEIADDRSQDIKDQNTAQYQSMVNSSAVRYIQSKAGEIQSDAAVTLTAPRKITYNEIRAAGFIPTGYANITTNAYNQTSCVFVYKDPAKPTELKALLVTEGGQAIDTGRVPRVAELLGASGGYILPNAPTVAVGTYAKWSENIPNDSCSGTRSTSGHIASQLYLDTSNLTQNYLYRNEVPGFPEANSMNTPLIMNATVVADQACTTLGSIARDTEGTLLTCSGTPATYKSSGSRYWKDPVNTKAELDALVCDASKAGETRVVKTPTVGAGTRAYSCSGTAWEPLMLDDNGNINVSGTLTVSKLAGDLEVTKVRVRGATCVAPDKAGSLARDSSGLLLSCQNISGVLTWKKALGETGGYQGLYDYLEGQEISCTVYHPQWGRNITGFIRVQNGQWFNRLLVSGYSDSGYIAFRETNTSGQVFTYASGQSSFDLIQYQPRLTTTAIFQAVAGQCSIGGCPRAPQTVASCQASFPPPN